jgi:hypothetical protein
MKPPETKSIKASPPAVLYGYLNFSIGENGESILSAADAGAVWRAADQAPNC